MPRPTSIQGLPAGACVSLIGMAGSGKSTVGRALAALTGLSHIDTDALIEEVHGQILQAIVDRLGREAFVAEEERIIASLAAGDAIISTGGSVIYGPRAVARLRALGPVVWLDARPEIIHARVARNPERGLAIAPGQDLDALMAEREPLYRAAADLRVDCGTAAPEVCARMILDRLRRR